MYTSHIWVSASEVQRRSFSPLFSGSYPSPKAGATLVMHKDLLVLFGGWTRPSPYPLHQPERFFDEIHTYSPSKNWWVATFETNRRLLSAMFLSHLVSCLFVFSPQVELYSHNTWPATHGWTLVLCDWKHHGGLWRIVGSPADVRKNPSLSHFPLSLCKVQQALLAT